MSMVKFANVYEPIPEDEASNINPPQEDAVNNPPQEVAANNPP